MSLLDFYTKQTLAMDAPQTAGGKGTTGPVSSSADELIYSNIGDIVGTMYRRRKDRKAVKDQYAAANQGVPPTRAQLNEAVAARDKLRPQAALPSPSSAEDSKKE